MKYDLIFVLRSDDYHPVHTRLGSNELTIQEILYLDDSAQFISVAVDVTPEGTGNLSKFTATIESNDVPTSWFTSAKQYAQLRDIAFEVTLNETPTVLEPPPEEITLPDVEEPVKKTVEETEATEDA
ncbi:MAG: hypothetical protein LBP87_03270 [Planctomycetaceae bacterium]|jgi:hypothetical protein|nr:hypothetical protein [Planctomycetaceae bacterium]